jgi:hypothetical protein
MTALACAAFLAAAVVPAALADRPGLPVDANAYWHGAVAARDGRTPYERTCYVYPPPLALALAPAADLDPATFRVAWTLLLGLAAVGLAVSAAALTGLGGTPWGLLAPAFLASETVRFGIEQGNVSVLVAALLAFAGLSLRRAPAVAGAAIAAATALKVTPAVALVFLAVAGWRRRDRHLRVAAAWGAALVLACGLLPWTSEFLAALAEGKLVSVRAAAGSNFAPAAWLDGIGLVVPDLAWPAVAAFFAALLGWRRRGGYLADWAVVHLLVILASPVVWSHFLALALVPALALAAIAIDPRAWPGPPGRARRALVACLAAALLLASSRVELFYDRSWAGRHLAPLVPVALLAVAAAVLARRRGNGPPLV